MKKLFPFLSALFVLLSACQKTPVSCISADKKTAGINETINFSSCSENGVKYVWDFGDGSAAAGETASHAYSAPGTYLVTLTAYSKKDRKWDDGYILITVSTPKKKYLTKIIMNNFPPQDPNGNDWDPFVNTEPDIYINLSSGNWQYGSTIVSNATSANLPYTWDLSPVTILLTDTTWTIEMLDDDTPTSGPDLMAGWTLNPDSTGIAGMISLVSGSADIQLFYQER
jgi:PKD repeat protein